MSLPDPPVALLLAAGAGTRWRAASGRPDADKLLQPLPDGTPMAVAVARLLRSVLPRVVAVTRPGSDELAATLEQAGARVVVAPDSVQGMGHSLAAGVRASADAAGWLVMPGDMPQVLPATVAAVAAAVVQPGSLAAPAWQGRRGHPVGFGRAYREELLALTGDAGARSILQRHAAALRLLDGGDPGVLLDFDVPG
ncbi:MAG: nucleotidyltransferase family protein [Aquabacterium sp.]|jgi:molybdenum cofactor cytidylyltransferase|nr:MAG: nucleotidyltransferase family protein [Aquabacterium sp.]TAL22287.1 MAG: nucleotidyltransferase family protein [Aquabacterium sp.]